MQNVLAEAEPRAGASAPVVEAFLHAIRNPLFSIRLELHTLRTLADRGGDDRASQAQFDAIIQHCDRQLDRAEQFLSELAERASPPPAADEEI
jgi:hypothetical protein